MGCVGLQVSFEEEGAEEGGSGRAQEGEAEGDAPATAAADTPGRKRRRKAEGGGAAEGRREEAAAEEAPRWSSVKWKSMALAQLQGAAAGRKAMKVARLRSACVQQAEAALGLAAGAGSEEAAAAFDSRVLRSSKFVVEKGRIRAASGAGADNDE